MLFIVFFEYSAENIQKVIEKFGQLTVEREELTREGRIPKLVFGPYHFNGQAKGFSVYETDDPDQLMNFAIFYLPEMTIKWVPLIESRKAAELWMKMKK
jgi:hypothetical protein